MGAVLVALLFGAAIGAILGLVGGGGAILTVPILVYVLGESVQQATIMSLVIVGITALAGTIPHARAGHVSFRTALLFAGVGLIGTVAGTALHQRVSGTLILLLFGVLMLGVAARMALQTRGGGDRSDADEPVPVWQVVASGIGVGGLTGFFGVGGGFLIVPALVLVLRFPMRIAVGTSLAIISLNSLVALAARHDLAMIDLPVALLFVVGGFLGSAAGSRITGFVSDRWLSRGFAALVAVVGLFLIAQNALTLT